MLCMDECENSEKRTGEEENREEEEKLIRKGSYQQVVWVWTQLLMRTERSSLTRLGQTWSKGTDQGIDKHPGDGQGSDGSFIMFRLLHINHYLFISRCCYHRAMLATDRFKSNQTNQTYVLLLLALKQSSNHFTSALLLHREGPSGCWSVCVCMCVCICEIGQYLKYLITNLSLEVPFSIKSSASKHSLDLELSHKPNRLNPTPRLFPTNSAQSQQSKLSKFIFGMTYIMQYVQIWHWEHLLIEVQP